jgi:hypothetical protein
MGLQDTIDETKALLEEIENAKDEPEAEVEPQEEQEAEPEVEAEAEAEEQPEAEEETAEEEAKEEPKEEAPKEPDASVYAKMRRLEREAQAAREKAEKLEAKMAEGAAGIEDSSEDEVHYTPEIQELIRERNIDKAEKEFMAREIDFAKSAPDYEGISNSYKKALYDSVRIQNPNKNSAELLEQTRNILLVKASTYLNKGLDPIQELYEEARSLGFKAEAPKEETASVEKEIKPDLKKVSKNRSKNAGMVGAQGSGTGGQVTREAAASMTTAEFMALPASERMRLINGG